MSGPGPSRQDVPLEDEPSRDDTDTGWGETSSDDDDFYLRERPPHWG